MFLPVTSAEDVMRAYAELKKIAAQIRNHPQWQKRLHREPQLSHIVQGALENVRQTLHSRMHHYDDRRHHNSYGLAKATLERDYGTIQKAIHLLAPLWLSLQENNQEIGSR